MEVAQSFFSAVLIAWLGFDMGIPEYKSAGLAVESAHRFLIFQEGMFHTLCPGRNVPDFGRIFLKLKYTDLT